MSSDAGSLVTNNHNHHIITTLPWQQWSDAATSMINIVITQFITETHCTITDVMIHAI